MALSAFSVSSQTAQSNFERRRYGGISPEDYIRFSCQLYCGASSTAALEETGNSRDVLTKLLENQTAKIYASVDIAGGGVITLTEDAAAAATAATTREESTMLWIGHAGTGKIESLSQLITVPIKEWNTVLRQHALSWMQVVDQENVVEQLRGLEYTLVTSSSSLILQVHPDIATAVSKGRKLEELLDDSNFSNDEFLNTVQAGVSDWIGQIRTLLSRTKNIPPLELAVEEVRYWVQLQISLTDVQKQLENDAGVVLTLNLLRSFKRFVATRTLETIGLESAIAYTSDVVHFLKPLPLDKVASFKEFSPQMTSAFLDTWNQLHKIRQSRYPLDRVLQLGLAITRLMRDTLLSILNKSWMFWDYVDYERGIHFPSQDVLMQLNDKWDDFRTFVADQAKRRKFAVKIEIQHAVEPLEKRLQVLHDFRSNHERLLHVLKIVQLEGKEVTPRSVIGGIDVLDLSVKGQTHVEQALEDYAYQMEALEERLAKLLRDKLAACNDAESMFRVFARYHLLLTRPRVRAAVKDFQVQLITTVASAIQKLQMKFVCKYEDTSAARLSRLRGIPPVSGKILWACLMERRVHSLMSKMENVLGKNWGQELEGRQLKKAGDELLAKLDAKVYFRKWVIEWEKQVTAAATSRFHSYPLLIESIGSMLFVKVNFDDMHSVLSQEIRHLKWLGFTGEIPRTLLSVADEAIVRYPHAVAILTALSTYRTALSRLNRDLEKLVLPELLDVRDCIAQAFGVKLSTTGKKQRRVRWQDASELPHWVDQLVETTQKLEDRVDGLLVSVERINASIATLEDVEYDKSSFRLVLAAIQSVIDEMSLSGYSGLFLWVQMLASNRIAAILSKRLQAALQNWILTFKVQSKPIDQDMEPMNSLVDEEYITDADLIMPKVTVNPIHIDIILRNQEITSVPTIPTTRSLILHKLNEYIGIICMLPRPVSGRYEVFESASPLNNIDILESPQKTFNFIIQSVPSNLVAAAYNVMEHHIRNAASFVDRWLAYQTLWDTQVSDAVTLVRADIEMWQALLLEVTQARLTLDSSATVAAFGLIVVKFAKVQSQVNLKYDSWQKELQGAFASILVQRVQEIYEKIDSTKTKLEATSLDSASIENIVLGVTFIQEVKQTVGDLENEIVSLSTSERLLKKQRYVFHNDWIESSVVSGLLKALLQVLDRRVHSMEQQMPVLQVRVLAESKTASNQLSQLIRRWEQEKPLRGKLSPVEAMEILSKFEMSLQKSHINQENLVRAKDALGLDHTADNPDILDCIGEVSDIKKVWGAVMGPYKKLELIKETPWATFSMRKVKRNLDDLLVEMRSLPNRIRQYDAYSQLHDTISGYIASHGLFSDLKTEALKERHWKTILQRLSIHVPLTDLSLGVLWDNGILTRKKDVVEIIALAHGEMALEVFLRQINDRWMKQELELVLYQNRTRLIRGWDELFATLDDHISGLALMKSSPYYRSVREFQEERKLWEDRLTNLRTAFDSWVDVQRRWVYLEGILFGSSDIKAQLPAEWSRFKNVDSEFVVLMRRISGKPFAIEILNIDNLQQTLERLINVMSVIQRALGDYLSKQRTDFSRFYFLGDDDLLDIMGNSGEPGKVLSHVGKMFAGIASAKCVSNGLPDGVKTRLEAMVSKDGEIVPFHRKIDVRNDANVKDWLKALESEMKVTIATLLGQAVSDDSFTSGFEMDDEGKMKFHKWVTKFPAQVMILASQINWSMCVDKALSGPSALESLESVLIVLEWKLEVMATFILHDLVSEERKKFGQLITELVRQRDVVRQLRNAKVCDPTDFRWLYHLRYYYNPSAPKLTEQLTVLLSNAKFHYGFEYLGIGDRLVQTPLTDKCYLTLTQALHFRLGGSPFGPAGTGKTESIKALGAALGRFVLVFNCDESFDYSAMGRLLAGLSQVGAWGCFDEFNRLEERILSAVSQQILTIQRGLLERQNTIKLLDRPIVLHENVGIFITTNPGYEGRSNLPDNLKTLFRSFAMVVPDRCLIAQVMLYSQGVVTAEDLSVKIVALFQLCEQRMSKQRHYDFGLRALKTLLMSAGALKRQALEGKGEISGEELARAEKNALIMGTCNNVLPKLIEEDIIVFSQVLQDTFPGSDVTGMDDEAFRFEIKSVCAGKSYVPAEQFVQKLLQLKQVLEMRHGVMVVGKSGKSVALQVLLEVLERIDDVKGDLYVIDPKAISKDRLYGSLDGTTLEWTDGVFTCLLRRIIDNQKGEADRRHWILFDGDIDPEWAENLNSVLDDNMMLTLPSGERLSLPSNVRIIFEVDSLAHTTLATVSRCGMVWFSDDVVTPEMVLEHLIGTLANEDLIGDDNSTDQIPVTQIAFIEKIRPFVSSERSSSLVIDALNFSMNSKHIMDPSRDRLFHTFKAMLIQGIIQAIEYDDNHPDIPMTGEHMDKYAKRWLIHSLMWSFCGSCSLEVRSKFSEMLLRASGVSLPGGSMASILDYRVRVENGEYELWSDSVPKTEIESHRVASTNAVITTTDTVRHSDVISSFLGRRLPLILCGPPGSGKTMTLTTVLQSIQGVILASLNFSSRTTPDIILKTFSQYCCYIRRGRDIMMEPVDNLGSRNWLVVFCDEINLPEEDAYGTQRIILFMRQLVEQRGFWRSDNVWIKINRIQFVGACNPPSDAGRVKMSHRFLRHVSLLFVDFPAKDSLLQIYRTFNGGLMKLFPNLKGESESVTEAMVEFYLENQSRFSAYQQPQYFYSPRELSRWVRGIYEAVKNLDSLTRDELVSIWAHEGLRLFSDRLVRAADKQWCNDCIDIIAQNWFAGVDFESALKRPLFYTAWLSKETRRADREELKDFILARLRVFYEEELDVPLVVFDEVIDHVLRIDRVLRQPMGHLLLVGDSGAGKTVLSKFVSWMNGLSIFQIKAHSRYGLDDFNEDLRTVMRRVGVNGERVCFIFDESNVLSSGFIEAVNALLASGEVPGLFDGEEYASLVSSARENAIRDGIILDSEEEVLRHFTKVVQQNLHVVFTINPSGGDWKSRSTTSPALFNRCVVDWFGTWSNQSMAEVAREFTMLLDMGDSEAAGGSWGIGGEALMKEVQCVFEGANLGGLRHAVVASLVNFHQIAVETAEVSATESTSVTRTFLSPRDYLALIQNFVSCLREGREKVEDEQLHVIVGLEKLRQTQLNVAELKSALGSKTKELKQTESLANEKLQQMVADQNEAEKRKDKAEEMSAELHKQEAEVNRRKDEAQRDLDEAEPALKSAQQSVRGIKKRDLDEIRNLVRPPNNVKLTLECVALMLGESSVDWTEVRKLIAKTDFIPNIINFDADKLSSRQIKIVSDKYFDGNPDLTEESVSRSSKACGPLYKWAESQIKYSTIYNNIQPLRDEVALLEAQANVAKVEKEVVETEVSRLESSIDEYKSEYARLIRDVETLKLEMTAVTRKIDRAEILLLSVGRESVRWAKSSDLFQTVMKSLIGDSLLMAGFLTYAGFFDFKTRFIMTEKWKKTLDAVDIDFRHDLGLVESLSTASQRLTWQSLGLPSDQLSLENGVILEHGNRFPLVVDPSGQVITFLMNKYKGEKIQTAGFLDKSFSKTLIGAVRFGTTLLIEGVEKLDPLINPILNKELQRTGGRTLVRIGTEEVDFSPNFRLILTTKNPAVRLTPDICSRVTLVNFTITPDSLQSRSLSSLVRSIRPELEVQRSSLVQLQSEQNVKLRELEDQMLATISACEGSILDDDRVVASMETLMKEGSQVEEQLEKSDEVMCQVREAVGRFEPFATVCRKLYVLLASLRELSFLYEFPAHSFMTILEHCSRKCSGTSDMDEIQRVDILKPALFREIAGRIGRGLQVEDKIVMSILLARMFSEDSTIGSEQVADAADFVQSIVGVFDSDFPWQGRSLDDLLEVTELEIGPTTPLLVCSAPGHDVSGRVEAMARDLKKELAAIAMGSTEGFDTAENHLSTASQRGSWVMLKNVHLCINWLNESFVKKIQALEPHTHKEFRVIITSEINPKLPTALLRICDKLVVDAPTGIKASLRRFFSSISKDRFTIPMRNRLYLLLGLTHSFIQERLRFVPLGWTEMYEWTEADATHALDVIDSLYDKNGRHHKNPEKLPWDALRSTLCIDVFGGRITSDIDQTILNNLVLRLFVPQSFDADFRLAPDVYDSPVLPDGVSRQQILDWIERLPLQSPPTWIGLDRSAEKERSKRIADSIVMKISTLQAKCDKEG